MHVRGRACGERAEEGVRWSEKARSGGIGSVKSVCATLPVIRALRDCPRERRDFSLPAPASGCLTWTLFSSLVDSLVAQVRRAQSSTPRQGPHKADSTARSPRRRPLLAVVAASSLSQLATRPVLCARRMLSRTRVAARQLRVQINASRAVSVWANVPAGPPDPILGKRRLCRTRSTAHWDARAAARTLS